MTKERKQNYLVYFEWKNTRNSKFIYLFQGEKGPQGRRGPVGQNGAAVSIIEFWVLHWPPVSSCFNAINNIYSLFWKIIKASNFYGKIQHQQEVKILYVMFIVYCGLFVFYIR